MGVDERKAAAPIPPALAERGYRFAHGFRVRYRDIDMQGIVFNGNYMSYIDYGITEYFRALGFPWKKMESVGFDLVVLRSLQDFRGPAYLDDLVYVGVRCTRLGNSSFTCVFTIWREDEETGESGLVLEAENVYANYDKQTRKTRPIPSVIREAIVRLEGKVEGA